jgi:hypothetical protein
MEVVKHESHRTGQTFRVWSPIALSIVHMWSSTMTQSCGSKTPLQFCSVVLELVEVVEMLVLVLVAVVIVEV